MNSIIMKRILGVEKKNRVRTTVMIEKEILEAIKKSNLQMSDTINTSLEKTLTDKGQLTFL